MFRILIASLAIGLSAGELLAADDYNAQWIWADAGNPAVEAPAGKVWFRRMVRSDGPSTGMARVVCDDAFTLYVNGRKIGSGEGNKLYRYNLNGIVGRGPNIIAIETENKAGKAGLYIDGEVRNQGSKSFPFDTDASWKYTTTAPTGNAWINAGFDAKGWKPVKVIGAHADSPWTAVELKDSYLDRFAIPEGFELKRIAGPDVTGGAIAITWGERGRLIVSRQRGPIMSLVDEDGDGDFEKAVEYNKEVHNCQGLCMIGGMLYAVGDGPDGVGIYTLRDTDGDDKADEVKLLYKHARGMGEHGPHDIVLGPDGWLYHNMGNHAWVTQAAEPTTAVRDSYEGYLLDPKFEDARGHASGIKVPGGTVWRFSPDGKQWWCETAGFRNEYDVAFNANGDLFTFDSDMEWDVGMPWYRPIRVNHCIPGAEFGWRSGAAKWPASYPDSLPGTVDLGRGSPTGVVFYEHTQFPEMYQGSFLVCDWSMGRLMVVPLEKDGATYKGTYKNLVTGNPLNIADIEVDRDGSVVFCNGGRGTEGGIFRLTYSAGEKTKATAKTFDDVLSLPQIHAGWAREDIAAVKKNTPEAEWLKQATAAAKNGTSAEKIRALTVLSQHGPAPTPELLIYVADDDDPQVRAFATWLLGNHPSGEVAQTLKRMLEDEDAAVQRRACEAFVRSGIDAPVESLLPLLGSDDRWLRFAARIALERIPVDVWKDDVLGSKNANTVVQGLIALAHLKSDVVSADEALKIEAELLTGKRGELTAGQANDVLRTIQLSLLTGGKGEVLGDITQHLLKTFAAGDDTYQQESARLLARLQSHEAAELLIAATENAKTHADAVHYALTLRYLNVGWNYEYRQRLLDWYESTEAWEGGHSFAPYVANIVGESIKKFQPEDRSRLLAEWKQRPYAIALMLERSTADEIPGLATLVTDILNDRSQDVPTDKKETLIVSALNALAKSNSADARQAMRALYDGYPDRREVLARGISENSTAADKPYLIRSLQAGGNTTLQLCIRGLANIKDMKATPAEIREILLAAMKLGEKEGVNALKLLAKLSGQEYDGKAKFADAVAGLQNWYHETYPDAPLAELPQEDLAKTKYSFQQLIDHLTKGAGKNGDVANGKLMFTKANCIKCHRFGNEGKTIGPDLTSVRRRFQKKEIVESIVHPSRIISDQFRMVSVITDEGVVHNGMPVPGLSNDQTLVLLLSDATQVSIPRSSIDEQAPSKTSVMPVGALKELTLKEIADLFAFLETSKFNEVTSTASE